MDKDAQKDFTCQMTQEEYMRYKKNWWISLKKSGNISTFIMLDVRSNYSITKSGLIPGGQNSSRDRQTVFLTAVNPLPKNYQDPVELDLTKPRLASYKQKWKVHQDTVYWVDFQFAQRKGLKFYQTRSNAVILHDTLRAYCISKSIVMKSEEIKNQKVYVSLRPPPTISFKDN